MGNKANSASLVEAKLEYTKLLLSYLSPLIYEAIIVLYESSVNQSTTVEEISDLFSKELLNIPKWNNEVVREETERLRAACPMLDELLTAVFLSNVKILTSIRHTKLKTQMKVTVPSTVSFVHNIYITIGKEILYNIDLFDIEKLNDDITRNRATVGAMIDAAIEHTIRSSIPLKHLLDVALPSHSDHDSSDDEQATVNDPSMTHELSGSFTEPERIPDTNLADRMDLADDTPFGQPTDTAASLETDQLYPEPEMDDTSVAYPVVEPLGNTHETGLMDGVLSRSDDECEDTIKEVAIDTKPKSFFDN